MVFPRAAPVELCVAAVAAAALLYCARRSKRAAPPAKPEELAKPEESAKPEGSAKQDIFAPLRALDLRRTPVAIFWRVLNHIHTKPEDAARARAFKPRAGDVVALGTWKCGQTWTLAQLRKLSLGEGSGTDSQLAIQLGPAHNQDGVGIPWLEHMSARTSMDADQPGAFRVFKTHMTVDDLAATIKANPDARFVACLRAPHDVPVSLYRHLRGFWVKRCGDPADFDAAYTADSFAHAGLPPGYFEHVLDVLAVRKLPNVHLIWYEAVLEDPAAALEDLAAFLNVPLSEQLTRETLAMTSYECMANSSAFLNVSPGGGKYGAGKSKLSADAIAEVDARWASTVTAALGHKTYEQLYEGITGKAFPYQPTPKPTPAYPIKA